MLTAHHIHSNATTSRLLRIQLENIDDNSPVFPKGAPRRFMFTESGPIGRIEADDADGDFIYYYLVPSCSESSDDFIIDKEFGELNVAKSEKISLEKPVTLCVVASPNPNLDVSSIKFSPDRQDMTKVVIAINDGKKLEPLPSLKDLNGKVQLADSKLEDFSLNPSIGPALENSYNFSVSDVKFKPSEMVPPLATVQPMESLFSVDKEGIVRPTALLAKQPQGVYEIDVEAKGSNEGNVEKYSQEFHLLDKQYKLKYVLDTPMMMIAKKLQDFEVQINEALKSDEMHLALVFERPRIASNVSRTAICFHATLDGTIITTNRAQSILMKAATANQKLEQFYNAYSVQNIEECIDKPVANVDTLLAEPSTLLIAAVLALLIFIFFCLIVYLCFVRRYRDYLAKKEKALKLYGPQAPMASPTFVLAPPPPVMPMIGYYDV